MQKAPLPSNESERLARLRTLGVLDTLPEQAFDDITALAASICGTPIALVSFVDEDRQWFKSRLGIEAPQTSRELAFCAHAILQPDQVMVVPDAFEDVRFRGNPLVEQDPGIRFYAGAPIVTADGYAVGTVCVIDRQPHRLDPPQVDALRRLARLANHLLEQRAVTVHEVSQAKEQVPVDLGVLLALLTVGTDLKSFIDTDYVYRYANNTYLEYWSIKYGELVGKSVPELMGEKLFKNVVQPNLDRALAGESVFYEAEVDFPAHGKRFVEVWYQPARNASGKIIGAVVRVHDAQERKERENVLRETVAALERKTLEQERFIHIVSHDLREPINTICNFSSLLVSDKSVVLSAANRKYLGFVEVGGRRMKALLESLLDYLRLEHHSVQRQRVNFTDLAEQVRDDLSAALQRSGGRIEFDGLPEVIGDVTLLRIALQNLAANGIKFVAKGQAPVVRISSREAEGQVLVRVEDNGIGIPADRQAKLFEMFKRLHTRSEYEGTGLGLSIVRRIADLHGGRVIVESEPGKGSAFTLALPVASAKTS